MKSREKAKKIIFKTFWIAWGIIGIFILFMMFSMYNKMHSITGQGIVGWVILFTLSLYTAIIYFGATLLFIFARWLIKKIKKKRISHEHKFSGKIKRRKPEVSSQ